MKIKNRKKNERVAFCKRGLRRARIFGKMAEIIGEQTMPAICERVFGDDVDSLRALEALDL